MTYFKNRKEILNYLTNRNTFGMYSLVCFSYDPICDSFYCNELFSPDGTIIDVVSSDFISKKDKYNIDYCAIISYPDNSYRQLNCTSEFVEKLEHADLLDSFVKEYMK